MCVRDLKREWISYCGSPGGEIKQWKPLIQLIPLLPLMRQQRPEKQQDLGKATRKRGLQSVWPAAFTSLLSSSGSGHKYQVSWVLSSWVFSPCIQVVSSAAATFTRRLDLSTWPPDPGRGALRETCLSGPSFPQPGRGWPFGPSLHLEYPPLPPPKSYQQTVGPLGLRGPSSSRGSSKELALFGQPFCLHKRPTSGATGRRR